MELHEATTSRIARLEKTFELIKPVSLCFSRVFRKKEDALISNLDVRFSRRSSYLDPAFNRVGLYSGRKLLDQVDAPFSLIRAYYQKRPLAVERFYTVYTDVVNGVKVDYELVIHQPSDRVI